MLLDVLIIAAGKTVTRTRSSGAALKGILHIVKVHVISTDVNLDPLQPSASKPWTVQAYDHSIAWGRTCAFSLVSMLLLLQPVTCQESQLACLTFMSPRFVGP